MNCGYSIDLPTNARFYRILKLIDHAGLVKNRSSPVGFGAVLKEKKSMPVTVDAYNFPTN